MFEGQKCLQLENTGNALKNRPTPLLINKMNPILEKFMVSYNFAPTPKLFAIFAI